VSWRGQGRRDLLPPRCADEIYSAFGLRWRLGNPSALAVVSIDCQAPHGAILRLVEGDRSVSIAKGHARKRPSRFETVLRDIVR
jgi:hypothetical protein